MTREMTLQLHDSVEQDMRPLIAAYSDGRLPGLIRAVERRVEAAQPGASYYLLLAPDGSLAMSNMPPLPPEEGWRRVTVSTELKHNGRHSSGHRTLIGLGVRLDHSFIFVGRGTARLEETQALILRSLRWVIAGTLVLSLAGGMLLSRGALRRVEAINRTARAIMEGDLSQRIPVGRSDDEMNRLARNINAMLDRIDELMESLRQVVNDIAHDMRTPLGRLRQRLEVARSHDTTAESYRETLDDAVQRIGDILDLFSALLRIAQIEAGARTANFTDVDLADVARTIAEVYEPEAEEHGQILSAQIDPGLHIRGDRDLLTQMLANLVENAIRHAPPGSHLDLRLDTRPDGGTDITVADDGPGIAAADREKVLRRFHRLESSRGTPGSGLGLSMVKAIADLHDAETTLADHHPGKSPPCLRVSVRFPAADKA
jgi:signal transduction histidine kinase